MKKIKINFLTMLIYLLPLFLICGCHKREIKNLNSAGKTLVCFGDSITFGYGVEPGEDFPKELARLTNREIINSGIDGDTSTEALRRLNSDVLQRKPYLVIVEFGGNDFLRKTPVEETAKNIREMILTIQKNGAMVVLMDISAGLFMADYRKEYSKIAKETDSIFVESVLSNIITNPNMKSDFLHPNKEGYKLIAQRVYRAIQPHLLKRSEVKK